MAELIPYPFGKLVSRMFRELETRNSIFDLPKRKFFAGDSKRDLSVRFHGRRAATPLGPAAGPHSQMAQNIVLAWLGGSRIIELKTVQILDELKIPRPCIDMQNVGYNVEWSQELKLEQSLEEYVKASMLIRMLEASGKLSLPALSGGALFDMSVGYDLKGIQSERVQSFIRGMKDCSALIDRLRPQIPAQYKSLRDLDFDARLSGTLTLSTFHGCPPEEIERIILFLLETNSLDCVVKLNPTLLGKDEVRRILTGILGYRDLRVPDAAFEKDAKWEQASAFVERLRKRAAGLGRSFGVKFSNTLIVENHRDFFPKSEGEMYLSGPPLHVLAIQLAHRLRKAFGDSVPVSFSAGIDRFNFPDAAALGLVPVTVCTDLLKPGGYGRQQGYLEELGKRMDKAGASDVDGLILRGFGNAEAALAKAGLSAAPAPDAPEHARWVSEAKLLNTAYYAEALLKDARYAREKNTETPKKIGSRLKLFDCVTCDKCVPVCPNDANFTFTLPVMEIPLFKLRLKDGAWESVPNGSLKLERKHQIGNFADFCNECGNCDVFCPEDGGPYILKPRFFGSLQSWRELKSRDGFFLERTGGEESVFGRFEGLEYRLAVSGELAAYSGPGFALAFRREDPEGTVSGHAEGEVDMAYYRIMDRLRQAILGAEVNYLNA
ncbi:MAG: glutamate synthase [Elusimicrobiota bacterium]